MFTLANSAPSQYMSVAVGHGALTVEISRDEEWWIVSDHESGMFGEGRSFQEAWDDLFIHFRIDKDALEANEDRLATDLRPELARLRILFPEKS